MPPVDTINIGDIERKLEYKAYYLFVTNLEIQNLKNNFY